MQRHRARHDRHRDDRRDARRSGKPREDPQGASDRPRRSAGRDCRGDLVPAQRRCQLRHRHHDAGRWRHHRWCRLVLSLRPVKQTNGDTPRCRRLAS